MFKKISKDAMHVSSQGWLESRFHFSFAEYVNHDNVNFGVLRVLNDDVIHPDSGFGTHPHHNMEIISYVVDGEITHKDSLGNMESLKAGEVQYLSAGTGIRHSEYNMSKTEDLRLLQIWIIPPEKNLAPLYGSYKYKYEERRNKLLNVVSSQNGDAKVKIYQDVKIYVCELDEGKEINYHIDAKRQIYFVQIKGDATINGVLLSHSDAMEITNEKELKVKTLSDSHFLFIETPQEAII